MKTGIKSSRLDCLRNHLLSLLRDDANVVAIYRIEAEVLVNPLLPVVEDTTKSLEHPDRVGDGDDVLLQPLVGGVGRHVAGYVKVTRHVELQSIGGRRPATYAEYIVRV